MYVLSPSPRILPQMQSRSANWPARSAGTYLHARSRWSGSRPGDQNRATTSHLRQNPRRWRSDLHQGDHTQLDGFPSEMRCRGVALLASRISVPSPATPCTLFTPNGAPRGLISRICLLSFAGANTEACLRMVTQSHLSTLHLDFAHRRTVHQEPSTGAYTGRWPTSEEFASAAYSTPLQRTTSHSAASAPTALHAGLPLSSHVGAEQASSCCGCSDARMAA